MYQGGLPGQEGKDVGVKGDVVGKGLEGKRGRRVLSGGHGERQARAWSYNGHLSQAQRRTSNVLPDIGGFRALGNLFRV